MTCDYILLANGRIARMSGWGSLGAPDAEQALRAFLADPQLQQHFGLLVDGRQASPSPSSAGVHVLAELHGRLMASRARRTALIVRDDVQFGMARMFQILAESNGAEVAIFKDESDALEWLERGLDG